MTPEQPHDSPPPLTHKDWGEWTEEALGDRRQVYARDTTAPADAPLVYMPDHHAEEFRPRAQAGLLVCPVPGCPSPALTTRGSAERRDHFVHRQAPAGPDHDRAYRRRVATELLAVWAQSLSTRLEVRVDQTVGDVAVTVLVRSPKSRRRVALIYVDARLGAEAWAEHDAAIMQAGATPAWIFTLRPMYFSPPDPTRSAAPGSPLEQDRRRGDLVIDRAIYRAMRGAGRWPLLLSTDRRELANLLTPDSSVAARLGLRRPASVERVLHVVPHALTDCGLSEHGIVTPAVSRAVLKPGARRSEARVALTALARTGRGPPSSSPPPLARASMRSPTHPGLDLATVVRHLPARGATITYGELRRRCGVHDHLGDRALRDALSALRSEGHVNYHGPLLAAVPILVAR